MKDINVLANEIKVMLETKKKHQETIKNFEKQIYWLIS